MLVLVLVLLLKTRLYIFRRTAVFFFLNNKSVIAKMLCWQRLVSQLILLPIVFSAQSDEVNEFILQAIVFQPGKQ